MKINLKTLIYSGGGRKASAFTLAEVLITLTIIGVVAAITIPSVITNHLKKEYAIALKKNYSQIQNGFRYMMSQDGVDVMTDSSLLQSIKGSWTESGKQEAFIKEFSKTFSVIRAVSPGELDHEEQLEYLPFNSTRKLYQYYGDLSTSFYFTDGTIVYVDFRAEPLVLDEARENEIKRVGGHMFSSIGTMYVDVNGLRGPNKIGRDLFWFEIDNFGRLFAPGSRDHSIFLSCKSHQSCTFLNDRSGTTYHWSGNSSSAVGYSCNPKAADSYGYGCAARIMEEDWQMKY